MPARKRWRPLGNLSAEHSRRDPAVWRDAPVIKEIQMGCFMSKAKKKTILQADRIEAAAARVPEVVQKPRSVPATSDAEHGRAENPAEVAAIVEAAAGKIQKVIEEREAGLLEWHMIGRIVLAAHAALADTGAYGSQLVDQIADRCGLHSRKLYHCGKLAKLLTREQVAKLAVGQIPWRLVRELLSYVGDKDDREQRLAVVLERAPRDGTPAARRAFSDWLQEESAKRNPLAPDQKYIVVEASGRVDCRLMTLESARAMAGDRKVMKAVEVQQR